jgi:DME family drug/metabolite transporter
MLNKKMLYGMGFALCAAMLNASIGTLSKVLILNGLSHSSIAFTKTILAALILLVFLPFLNAKTNRFVPWYQIPLCAFFGIFVMFMFETKVYSFDSAANIVVALMAAACLTAMILGRFFLGEIITLKAILGATFAILGLALILGIKFNSGFTVLGTLSGICSGMGYGIFSVLMKK